MRAAEIARALGGARRSGNGWVCRCPCHHDRNPSLSVTDGDDGKALIHCHAGCSQEAVIEELRRRGLLPKDTSVNGVTALPPLRLDALARAKRLPVQLLKAFGCGDNPGGTTGITIPYHDADGNIVAVRRRLALTGARFRWRIGDRVLPYGLERLQGTRAAGWLLAVEGESDCWTAWHYGLPALGIPGKSTWRREWARYFENLEVFLWQEPGAEDLTERVAADLPGLKVIIPPNGVKDLSEAHLQGRDVPTMVAELKGEAVPAADLARRRVMARMAEARAAAEPVLATEDPLLLIEDAIRAQGYGGDVRPALLIYLAATTRLLPVRPGAMPAHALLKGPPSAGKSWTWKVVEALLPSGAYHVIDAGSPRVLIYDDADLQHRVVVFGEADSLPSGEDNPAASAIRNLLQDGRLHYKVTIRDQKTGDYTVRDVAKEGPTVLITTAVRSLGGQLMSRLFTVEVRDDPKQVCAALAAMARTELEAAPAPSEALVAYQALLQIMAPIDVVVPFARELATYIGRQPAPPRILRDFAKLLALIKAAAILRHHRRKHDRSRHLIATIEDYRTVYDLVCDVYRASASGASDGVRAVVEAVASLGEAREEPVRITDVAAALGLNKMTAKRRIDEALRGGWLVNAETRKGHRADLQPGEPLPEEAGVPAPETLREKFEAKGGEEFTAGDTAESGRIAGREASGNTVTEDTDGQEGAMWEVAL